MNTHGNLLMVNKNIHNPVEPAPMDVRGSAQILSRRDRVAISYTTWGTVRIIPMVENTHRNKFQAAKALRQFHDSCV